MPLDRSSNGPSPAGPGLPSVTRIFRADVVLTGIGIQLVSTSPLWAIPSPDLVINFFASTAQVLGLATVVLGGFAASSRRRHGKKAGSSSKWPFRVVLALFVVSLAANLLQYSLQLDEKNARLTTNLWRSSQEEGKAVGDVNLKSLSFSEQKEHPRGISTDEVSAILANPAAYNLIDVREPEEVEMGMIRGAWHRRYPDLQADQTGMMQEGKETILICESGNRSSELVNAFEAQKIHCRFMVGGYEKWVSEGRPLENEKPRSGGEIRDIPDYPNKFVLLDTPDVVALVESEQAVFIDVRYPGDFALGHLPKAINLPMRKMRKDELEQALTALPRDKPIIAPCYDKRSSFYGMILGLRLHRLGYDFRGRYTVPHEFALPVKDKEHVAQWKEEQQGKTLLAMAAKPLDAVLNALDEWTGHLAVAIVLLVILARLAFLPLTLKSDRDTLILRKIAPRLRELKAKLADDPGRLARAISTVQRREGVSPGRNAMASVCQLIVFLLLFTVVNDASKGSEDGFAWISTLASPDPLYVLPVLVSVFIVATLLLNAGKKGFWLTALRVACGGLLLAITVSLPAGDNVYLAANAGLLLLHSRWSKMRFDRSQGSRKRRPPAAEPSGIVPLVAAHTAQGTGGKAERLGRIMEEGLPVPDGFVITEAVLGRQKEKLELSKNEHRQLSKMWKRLQARNVAVRSSGLNEDGSQKSYAGVFESVLNVPYERLIHALDEVYQSMRTARAAAYGGGGEERGAIVVQKMVEAEYAGVLFTEHPGSSGAMLLEMVEGLGEALVSGTATPRSYKFGRVSGQPLDDGSPPVDMAPLLAMGKQVESAFGRPQDIEWAYAAGRFYILQARDITRSCTEGAGEKPLLEKERKRLLDLAERSMAFLGSRRPAPEELKEKPAFAQNEMSELLPRPTPLSLSIMDALWKSGGSTDLACRSLGIPYRVEEDSVSYLSTVFGALYVNRIEERARLGRAPGVVAAFKLSRQAAEIEAEFKEDFLPRYLEEIRIRESIDPARLRVPELLRLVRQWADRFISDTYYQAERINLATDFYVKSARIEIEKHGLDPAALLARIPETVVHRALSLLPEIREGEDEDAERLFLENFGHRAPHDYELSHPRYRESPKLVQEIASRAQASSPPAQANAGAQPLPDGVLRAAVERACRFQALKEEAKHHALRDLALIRSLAVEIGSRLELGEGIFHLTLEEVFQLSDEAFLDGALHIIAERRAASESARRVELPPQISIVELEAMEIGESGRAKTVRRQQALRGTRVSGDREVVGRARIVRSPEDMGGFQKGEILVARFTNPAWTPLFPIAGGIITEVGGWLSHAAIVAREYGVTAIVGVNGALEALEQGELLRLCADGGIERIRRERRSEDRVPLGVRAALTRQGDIVDALVRNLSRTGALVEVDEELAAGQGVSLQIEPGGPNVRGEVIRRNAPGSYAILFAKPLESLPASKGNGVQDLPKS